MPELWSTTGIAADYVRNAGIVLGKAIDLVDHMKRLNHNAAVQNGDLADSIVIDGRKISRKLREFAKMIDRTVDC